jgi:hypothetical protein
MYAFLEFILMSRACYVIKISLVVSSDAATLLGTNVFSLIQA